MENEELIKQLALNYGLDESDLKFAIQYCKENSIVKFTHKDLARLMINKMHKRRDTGYELYLQYKEKFDITREEILYMLDGTCCYNPKMYNIASDYLETPINELLKVEKNLQT